MSKHKITVIMPVYNTDPRLLKKSINSILNQKYPIDKVIIVNDGSSLSHTLGALKEIGHIKEVEIINQKNSGVSCARNKALDSITDGFVLFIDADDSINEDYVFEMARIVDQYAATIILPQIIWDYGSRIQKREKLSKKKYFIKDDLRTVIENDFYFSCPGALIDAKIAKSGKFDTGMRYGEDTKYFISISKNYPIFYSSKSEYYYYQNQNSATHAHNMATIDEYVYDIKQLFDAILGTGEREDMERVANTVFLTKINHAATKLIEIKCGYRKYVSKIKEYVGLIDKKKTTSINTSRINSIKNRLLVNNHILCHYLLTYTVGVAKRIFKKHD